jgi:RNA polymerase sigma-70 factor (family 1)
LGQTIAISPQATAFLVERLRAGDAAAFTEIYEAFAEPLVTYSYNILQDRDACRDIIHDIFLSLWLKRESLVIETSLQGYLFTAAKYQVLQLIRKEKVRESVFDQVELRIWGDPSPENLLYQKELQARLSGIVDALPDKAREVYLLSREHHLSYKEIAERLDISPNTVRNHLAAALKKIREHLGELLPLIILFLGRK